MKHHLGPQWNLIIHTCSSFHRTTITLSSFSTFYCFWLCRMFPPLASIKHTEKWTPLRSSNNHAELHTYFKIQLVFVLQSLAQACSVHSSLSSILFSCFHLPTDDVFFFFSHVFWSCLAQETEYPDIWNNLFKFLCHTYFDLKSY